MHGHRLTMFDPQTASSTELPKRGGKRGKNLHVQDSTNEKNEREQERVYIRHGRGT